MKGAGAGGGITGDGSSEAMFPEKKEDGHRDLLDDDFGDDFDSEEDDDEVGNGPQKERKLDQIFQEIRVWNLLKPSACCRGRCRGRCRVTYGYHSFEMYVYIAVTARAS